MNEQKKEVLVRTQITPNPHALKFIVNQPLKLKGKVTYRSFEEALKLPLAEALFNLENLTQVFISQNTLTVTHNGNWDNGELQSFVEPLLKVKVLEHDANFQTPEEITALEKLKSRTNLSPELQKIEEILDRTIRPGLQADGGDLEVNDFDFPELYISFEGACGSCPSSQMGTLQAIQSILQNEYHPDLQVIAE